MQEIEDLKSDKDIFICYRHKYNEDGRKELNNLFPNYIFEVLSKKYDVYFDSQSPAIGKTTREVEKIIDKCTNFIIIIEDFTFDKIADKKNIDYVLYELSYAWKKGKTIIPILKDWNVLSKWDNREDIADVISKLKTLTPYIVCDTTGMGSNADFIRLSIEKYLCKSTTIRYKNTKLNKKNLILIFTISIPAIIVFGMLVNQWVNIQIINFIIIICSSFAAYVTTKIDN